MKKIFVVLIFLLFPLSSCGFENVSMRDYDGIEVPAGTFIPVMNLEELSTAYSHEGEQLKFISTNDLYLFETNIIPKDTVFYGVIEKIYEPVVGTNGGMVIRITSVKFVDGFEIYLRGYIYTSNRNIIGCELTPPTKYEKMPHYQKGFWLGAAQMVAGPIRKMGEHLVINSGADLMVVLTSPAYITHTLTH